MAVSKRNERQRLALLISRVVVLADWLSSGVPKEISLQSGDANVIVDKKKSFTAYPWSGKQPALVAVLTPRLPVSVAVQTTRVGDMILPMTSGRGKETSTRTALGVWRNRPLDEFPYLILDARYEKIRHGGSVVPCAVLVAIGITPQGKRSILGVSVSLSEAEVHWRNFLASLQERGLHGVRYIVSDDHAGLKEARQGRFSGVPWQRCQFHLQQNAMQYVPKVAMREQVGDDLRNVFNAPDRSEAERQLQLLIRKYAKSAPKLAAWLETDLPEGLTVFGLPAAHRRKMRTTNMLERINKELKRRTRVATLFPNEASTLRLVNAVLSEITEEWETGKIYLNMKAD